ncbi:hypothetical protein FGO68_gene11587 [Halteria grandinella]|uniref:Protein kinase domain-containing protein n=1 Tax=Halteria grandinella TaxID=5974 RepID=A0A8J8SV39_HALGN|nr:hypothetical protein FGO68_gene11587 [Halteria grandinella]
MYSSLGVGTHGAGTSSLIGGNRRSIHNESGSQRGKSKISTLTDPLSLNGLDVAMRPILDYNARLLNGRLQVKKIITERSFLVYSEDFKDDLLLKAIPNEENIQNWIDLPPHTNVVTAFDAIPHDGKLFSLQENTNGGNMYQYIESLGLNLAITVPMSYIELIYDCAIQLAMGLEFAHNNGLVHGQFDLSNVVITKDTDNIIFKISDFRPATSMQMPLTTSEGSLWPFARNKKKITDAEKLELLMLKDIYALGICILEMMIGRVSSTKFSISLDSLPLTWAEFAESTPLIQVLVECINIDSISQRKGKLQTIKKLLIRDYKKFFHRQFYKMELPVIGKRTDVCNKKAIMALSRGEDELTALKHWEDAIAMKDEHFDTQLNYLLYQWKCAHLSDGELLEELSKGVFNQSDIGIGLKGIIKLSLGDITEGSEILTKIANAPERGEGELKNLKAHRFKQQIIEICESLKNQGDKYLQNRRVRNDHKEKIESIQFNYNSRYLATVSKDCANVWNIAQGTLGKRVITVPFVPADFASLSAGMPLRLLAAVNTDATTLVVYKGADFMFNIYTIDTDMGTHKLRETLDLQKELTRVSKLDQKLDPFDMVTDIRFLADGKHVRMQKNKKAQGSLSRGNKAQGMLWPSLKKSFRHAWCQTGKIKQRSISSSMTYLPIDLQGKLLSRSPCQPVPPGKIQMPLISIWMGAFSPIFQERTQYSKHLELLIHSSNTSDLATTWLSTRRTQLRQHSKE